MIITHLCECVPNVQTKSLKKIQGSFFIEKAPLTILLTVKD